jgi:hypothetical protein
VRRTDAKAIVDVAAKHAAAQIKSLIGNEINPNRARAGLATIADWLYEVLAAAEETQARSDAKEFLEPLWEALRLLRSATDQYPVDLRLVRMALRILDDAAVRVDSN